MKKQIVLSLSVLVVAMSSDLFAPLNLSGGTPAPVTRPVVNENNSASRSVTPSTQSAAQTVPADAAAAAADCTMADVAAVAAELAGGQQATPAGKAKARAYITGQPASGSMNKSTKLGRLGNKRK